MPFKRQDREHPGFVAVDAPYDCGQCVAHHAQKHEFPMLEAEDAPVWELYLMLQDQVRAGMDVIGLDLAALPAIFDLAGIPSSWHVRWPLTEKLRALDATAQAVKAEKRELEKQKRRADELDRQMNRHG